jgi:hypothetical protein
MIGLILLGGIITALFTSFIQLKKKEHLIVKEQNKVLQRHSFAIRMEDIFYHLKPWGTNEGFKTEKEGLFFPFDNRVDPDPDFSGAVLGRLSLQDQTLYLTIYADDAKTRKRIYPLYKGVSECTFRVLDETNEEPVWKNISQGPPLPGIISITIQEEGEKKTFTFFTNYYESTVPSL